MSLRPILIYGHPCLYEPALPIASISPEIETLAADMIETMYAAPGRGLAAPQVGESLRMFVVDAFWKDGTAPEAKVFINPEIISVSADMATHEEGCLSIPGVPVSVTRPEVIRLGWTALDGTLHEETFSGIEAVCIQHEYDHLEGVLITDRLTDAGKAEAAAILDALVAKGAMA